MWLGSDSPILYRQFRPRTIPNKPKENRDFGLDNAIRNVETEIKILKNKLRRYALQWKYINSIQRLMANGTLSDNKKKESQSTQIGQKKQEWMDIYDYVFGTR